ncbi:MAG TPA: tetratricopeptide repeat protein [Steroidobacteraceae bacterium]|jgi:tetratricopeptide (TPR) repeat protein|nr:tetratricopeptide repeat protein [Steroidobacteraceae bacterium]
MNRNLMLAIVVIALAAVGFWLYGKSKRDAALPDLAPVGANLLEGLGDYSMPVTAKSPEVQRWFDQGLAMTYGFNHDAAERSFLKAAELDPDCAMCWWGSALVLGPHVNSAMDPANNPKAWDRLQRAKRAASGATEKEQAFIKALSARYAENPPEVRRPLDEAYAVAMTELAAKYPDDLDAATLHAEAKMDLQPWDYWDASGQPKGHTAEVVSTLESVMARDPEHAGALHLYVHAVEASPDPTKGVAAADTLRELLPGSGHLVHMPAHIYARVGRWHDAVVANQKAIVADDTYLAICKPGPGVYPLGYVPHNHHFLWFAATMEGASEIARSAAAHTGERTSDPKLMRTPGFEAMQNFSLTPFYADVRFGRWDAVTATPKPADDVPYMQAMWNYGQAMAAVAQGRIEDAKKFHEALVPATENPAIEKMMAWDRYSLIGGVRVAERFVAAEIARSEKKYDDAIAALNTAVTIEDTLPYDEPPAWNWPTRLALGNVLMEAKKPADAEQAFRDELQRNPENGWSLHGLARALKAQGKKDEAQAAADRFAKAWANADVELGKI